MVRFLSDEWLAALAAAADAVSGLDPDAALVVEQRVEGVAYAVRLAGGRLSVTPGPAPDADLRLATDRATAAAVAKGDVAPQDAVAAGLLRIGGDLGALLRVAPALAGLDAAFGAVRADTSYD